MTRKIFQPLCVFVLFLSFAVSVFGQQFVCKSAALVALKPLPKLEYHCDENLTDSDDDVLTKANRVEAIKLYAKSLENLVYPAWWNTDTDDLNVCDFRKKAGALTKQQKWDYTNGNYYFTLLGNNRMRVVIARDPCYQTGFSGSNMFLLNHVGGKVYASEIIDGFFTRMDFPPGVNYATNGNEQIIEVATMSGGLYATITSYFFVIDRKTNRAVPKNLFKDDNGKLTNRITSMMILGEPEEYDLPKGAEALQIIKNGRLAKSFDVFNDTFETFGEDNHQKFEKQTLRWNGKFYE